MLILDTIKAPINCTDGAVRLYGGASALEGILHVCSNSAWGTVCRNYWDNRESNVVCHQLGSSTLSESIKSILVII